MYSKSSFYFSLSQWAMRIYLGLHGCIGNLPHTRISRYYNHIQKTTPDKHFKQKLGILSFFEVTLASK